MELALFFLELAVGGVEAAFHRFELGEEGGFMRAHLRRAGWAGQPEAEQEEGDEKKDEDSGHVFIITTLDVVSTCDTINFYIFIYFVSLWKWMRNRDRFVIP